MEIRMLQTTAGAIENGTKVVDFHAGTTVDVPTSLARSFIQMGAAVPTHEHVDVDLPEPPTYSEGVVAPTDDERVQELHAKIETARAAIRQGKQAVADAARVRRDVEDARERASAAAIVGDETEDAPSEKDVQQARDAERDAQGQLRAAKRAFTELSDQLAERLDALDTANREQARQNYRDLREHAVEQAAQAVAALHSLNVFFDQHRGLLAPKPDNGSSVRPRPYTSAVPGRMLQGLETWTEKQQDKLAND
jgi:hypothetical protein